MNIRNKFPVFLDVVLILFCFCLNLAGQDNRVRNLLVITTDDQGIQAGCYGDKQAITPHMDYLADNGVLFEQGYTTQASCSPSRASILTGLYPHQNGQYGLVDKPKDWRVHPNIPNLPSILKKEGFKTGILGKLHVQPEEDFSFDYQWSMKALDAKDTLEVRKVAKKTKIFFNTLKADERFFLYVNYFDPHRPFPTDTHQVDDLPEKPYTKETIKPLKYIGIEGPDVQMEMSAYYNGIKRLDVGLGMLWDALKQYDYWDDTLIILVGDHGPPFARAKGTVYEAGVQIPYLMRWPNLGDSGKRKKEFVSTVDILPTSLDALGIEAPESAGLSIRKILDINNNLWREAIFTEYIAHTERHYYPRRAVRKGNFKLIYNLDYKNKNTITYIGKSRPKKKNLIRPPFETAYKVLVTPPEFELYKLNIDPFEQTNLSGLPEYKPIQNELFTLIQNWMEKTKDPWIDLEELDKQRP